MGASSQHPAVESRAAHSARWLSTKSVVVCIGVLLAAITLAPGAPTAAGLLGPPVDRIDVAWTGDRLSIRAVNAPLASVLARISQVTGALIQAEDHLAERVTVDVGPMTIRAALQVVLDQSQHDYIFTSSTGHPDRVDRIVVIPRTGHDNGLRGDRAGAAGTSKAVLPVLDVQREQERQQRQFQQTFGACIAQGCDAS